MGNIKIVRGVFDTKLELEHAGVAAGFPSPADDYRHETLDFNRDFILHPLNQQPAHPGSALHSRHHQNDRRNQRGCQHQNDQILDPVSPHLGNRHAHLVDI